MIILKKKILRISVITLSVLLAFCIAFAALVWNGIIILNGYSADKYVITGIDVSSYQGAIDWNTLSSQKLSFVFIKATEGSTFVDKNFASILGVLNAINRAEC